MFVYITFKKGSEFPQWYCMTMAIPEYTLGGTKEFWILFIWIQNTFVEFLHEIFLQFWLCSSKFLAIFLLWPFWLFPSVSSSFFFKNTVKGKPFGHQCKILSICRCSGASSFDFFKCFFLLLTNKGVVSSQNNKIIIFDFFLLNSSILPLYRSIEY